TEAPLRAAGPGRSRRTVDKLLPLVGIVGGLLLWEIVSRVTQVTFLPPASDVIGRMVELLVSGEATPLLLRSLADLTIAFTLSAVVGVVLGLLMGMSWRVDAALLPFVTAMLSAPVIVFAPVFFAFFGLSRTTVQAIIVVHCVFVIISNVRDGARAARLDLLEMAQCFGAGPRQLAQIGRAHV